MFLECDATVPSSNDKKTGSPHDLARVIDALTSPPVRPPGVMSALYQNWTRTPQIERRRTCWRAMWRPFLLKMRFRAGQSPASMPHICHAGGRAFLTQPGAGHYVYFG
jgi:hypothetical protein